MAEADPSAEVARLARDHLPDIRHGAGVVEQVEHRGALVPGRNPLGFEHQDPVEEFDRQRIVLLGRGLGGPAEQEIRRIGARARPTALDQGGDALRLGLVRGLAEAVEQVVDRGRLPIRGCGLFRQRALGAGGVCAAAGSATRLEQAWTQECACRDHLGSRHAPSITGGAAKPRRVPWAAKRIREGLLRTNDEVSEGQPWRALKRFWVLLMM